MDKQRVHLTEEKETLLVPLYSKAVESKRPHPIINDTKAQEILEGVTYDFRELKIPQKTSIMLAMRAKKLDQTVQDYLARTQNPIVLHLGCGLDSRVLRVNANEGDWYDLDYPEVIELRKNFYEETDHYHMIPSSVTDPTWMGIIEGPGPACIIAEGLLMYLHEEDVRRLFVDLQNRLPGSEIAFDAFSRLTARGANRQPSIKKTGAKLYWGLDDPREIESWGRGMKLLDEWYFDQSEDIPNLSFAYRMMFKMMKPFRVARNAHRILRFRL